MQPNPMSTYSLSFNVSSCQSFCYVLCVEPAKPVCGLRTQTVHLRRTIRKSSNRGQHLFLAGTGGCINLTGFGCYGVSLSCVLLHPRKQPGLATATTRTLVSI